MLEPGEKMAERRVQETQRAAEILGVSRVEFLGYVDSGMMGTPENDAQGSFWTADLDEAAKRLAKILDEERADVLTIYDDHGGDGAPGHTQVQPARAPPAQLPRNPALHRAPQNPRHTHPLPQD